MIVQNIGDGGRADISFTVLEDDLERSLQITQEVASQLDAEEVSCDQDVSKVSIVGLGMATQTGVADRMFRALASEQINIEAITTSQIKVSALVARKQGLSALRAVHQEFELDKPPAARTHFGETVAGSQRKTRHPAAAADVMTRLQHMEELTIESITRDDSQACITLNQVPDHPGIAAQIFEQIAAEEIMTDMIVQSVGADGRTRLSLTVPQEKVEPTTSLLEELVQSLGGKVSFEKAVVILTVTGIGIRSHTGVAIRMFKALSEKKINIDMISTSEIRVNVVVAEENADSALTALQQAFADVIE